MLTRPYGVNVARSPAHHEPSFPKLTMLQPHSPLRGQFKTIHVISQFLREELSCPKAVLPLPTPTELSITFLTSLTASSHQLAILGIYFCIYWSPGSDIGMSPLESKSLIRDLHKYIAPTSKVTCNIQVLYEFYLNE